LKIATQLQTLREKFERFDFDIALAKVIVGGPGSGPYGKTLPTLLKHLPGGENEPLANNMRNAASEWHAQVDKAILVGTFGLPSKQKFAEAAVAAITEVEKLLPKELQAGEDDDDNNKNKNPGNNNNNSDNDNKDDGSKLVIIICCCVGGALLIGGAVAYFVYCRKGAKVGIN
jgi:hypothetical protein